MEKVGRNLPCPCGSGRKFKRCCGAPRTTTSKVERTKSGPSAPTISTSIPFGGPSGMPAVLIAQPVFQKGDPRNEGGPGGAPGHYRVVFTFSRPGFSIQPENSFSFEGGIEGDSHLAISPPAIQWSGPNPPVTIHVMTLTPMGKHVFRGLPNKNGFLGKLVLDQIDSTDLKAAYRAAYGAIGSFLSASSVYSDIPLNIFQADVTELRTGNSALFYVNSYRDAAPGRLPDDALPPDFRLYASLYREALNTSSPRYQLLCFFKIIEGIRQRNARKVAEARDLGLSIPPRPRESIPAERKEQIAWMDSIFPQARVWDEMTLESTFVSEALGKKVNWVIDEHLSKIRTRVAHAFLDSGEPTFSSDDATERDEVLHWLPLAKCIARLLLRNEFPEGFRR